MFYPSLKLQSLHLLFIHSSASSDVYPPLNWQSWYLRLTQGTCKERFTLQSLNWQLRYLPLTQGACKEDLPFNHSTDSRDIHPVCNSLPRVSRIMKCTCSWRHYVCVCVCGGGCVCVCACVCLVSTSFHGSMWQNLKPLRHPLISELSMKMTYFCG